MSCATLYFNPRIAFFSKMTTFKEKSVYVVFSIAIWNFFNEEGIKKRRKKSRRCSNSHKSQQRLRGSCSLIGRRRCQSSPVSSASTSHRRTAAAQLPPTLIFKALAARLRLEKRGEEEESASSDTAGEVRRKTESGAPQEAKRLWSKRRTRSGSDLRRGLCNCPRPPPPKVIFAQVRHVIVRQRQQWCPTRQLRGTLSFGEDARERTDRLVGTACPPLFLIAPFIMEGSVATCNLAAGDKYLIAYFQTPAEPWGKFGAAGGGGGVEVGGCYFFGELT